MTAPGPAGLLATEFTPEWDIALRPCNLPIVTAYKCSGDGRHRHYVVAPSAGELLTRLRAIRKEEGSRQ